MTTKFQVGDHVEIMPWEWCDEHVLWGQTATVIEINDLYYLIKLDNNGIWPGNTCNLEAKNLKHTTPEQAEAAKIAWEKQQAKLAEAKKKAAAKKKAEEAKKKKELEKVLMTCVCRGVDHDPQYLTGDFYQPLWWSKDEQFCARNVYAPDDFFERFPQGNRDGAKETQIDPIQLAADFYLLEAVKNGVLGDNDDEALLETAKEQFDNLVAFAAPLMREYLWWAICSELTYHSAVQKSFETSSWQNMRFGWEALMGKYGEEQACDWAMETFMQEGMWGGAFGGKPWADIVQVVKWKAVGKIGKKPFSDAMFLDRMFSLQHNTCTVFNKSSWKLKNDWNMGIDAMTCKCAAKPECGCKNVLNMHATGNIVGMMALATPDVVKLVQDQWEASGYGKIAPEESPYCKSCGSFKLEGSDFCQHHTPAWCATCDYETTKAYLYGDKCETCYYAVVNTGYDDSTGTANCYKCKSELIKDTSLASGFCSVCRADLKQETAKYGSKSMKEFLTASVFEWKKCECGVDMAPAYDGTGGCDPHPKNVEAYKAYTDLVSGVKPVVKPKKKVVKKAPAKKSFNVTPSFAELLNAAANLEKKAEE